MNQRVYAVEKKIEEIKTQVYRDFTKMQKANVMSIVPEAFMKVKPPVFDGSVSWSVYKLQFDAAAKVNQWNSDEEKATALILSLRGKASELLQSIPNPQDYAALVKTMELRYGDEYLPELYRVKLKTRRQQSNETLRELEADIARLAHLAYPTATQDLLEIIITDAFADALRDPELKKAIRVSGKHKTSEALVYALLYQAAKDESENICQDQRREVKNEGRKELRKTNEALEKCKTIQIPQGQRGVRKRCWNCGGFGHLQRNCAKRSFRQEVNQHRSEKVYRPCRKAEEKGVIIDCRRLEVQAPEPRSDEKSQDAQRKDENVAPIFRMKEAHNLARKNINRSSDQMKARNDIRVNASRFRNKAARTIRDTGSTIVGINRKLVEDHEYTGKNKACIMFDGKTVRLPVARVNIKTPYYTGSVEACVIDHDQIDLIIGNIPNIKKCTENEIAVWKNCCGMATTRSCSKDVEEGDLAKLFELSTMEKEQDEEQDENTETIKIKDIGFNKEKFITKQKNDPELLQLAKKGGRGGRFYVERGTLVREIEWHGKKVIQFVVPREFRQLVMENGHDIAHTEHLGLHKTKQRIFQKYYWPSINKDIKSYVTSCQLCSRKGARNIKAPLQRMDLPDRPFSKIAIDLIGPMPVVSNRGHRYILTVIDVCSRWPEAIPLKRIEARDIVQALYTLFTRFGFPREILSDRDTQFNCQLATTFLNMFGIQQRFTTSYYPQSTCERFNVNLKKSLYKVMDDKPKEWDMAIPSILFAYRESRNEITGFSPFQMIYGGNPRGPMTILKDLIIPQDHVVTNDSYDIVTETRNQIIKACEEADRQMLERNELAHSIVNEHRKMAELEVGQDVLVLHKDNNNASATNWLGPYKVARKISDMDYEIDIDSMLKIFHVDLLKEFTPRQRSEERSKDESMTMSACVTEEMETEERFRPIETVATESRQTWKDVMVDGVSLDRAKEIKALIEEYKNIFTDLPGKTNASAIAIGGCLMQKWNGVPHPVLYVSRKLTTSELKYDTIEKEGLAIVWGITKLGFYLMGAKFELWTDHAPLAFINTNKLGNNRIARWALQLMDYNFEVRTIPGKDNVIADTLSRCT
ncbi:uncharacterized protein LOC129924657 [Biomphalaria glabrata]|uniref:Uncharacterized protein LOC129924657 n=1 Tax=Biomphalaria glabrata TaxID=6526 RepID=A0A9W2ZPZ5_BIOGL|nr:uncharacterized protein LOC129924657 [Biomphalaria glabrata]